jgi:hypothetical protein
MGDDTPASILILTEDADRLFGSGAAISELLRLEGINDLETLCLSQVDEAALEGRSLVIVGPADPASRTVEMLLSHVESGGGLIAMAPGEAFAESLGLKGELTGRMHPRMSVQIDGFPDTGLPIRGWAQHYLPAEGTEAAEVAALQDRDGGDTGYPAILQLDRGKGTIVATAFDLAASTCLLRFGDPLLAGARTTGVYRMRPTDLFEGWQQEVDQLHPVADLACHLLRELCHRAWPKGTVLPWLWYFPGDADTALLLTSDDDWSKPDHFERLVDSCEKHEARLTFYLVQERSVMEKAWMETLMDRGFDFSIHPDLRPPIHAVWEERLRSHIGQFQDAYGRSPGSSVRNHAITWSGYMSGARIEADQGFTFDTNYFSLLPTARYYMSGAGLPLRFVDPMGEAMSIFQIPTQFSDETTLAGLDLDWSLNLTPDQAVELVTGMMRTNAQGQHSLLCVNAHPVSFATYSAPLWEPVMAFGKSENIPVIDVGRFGAFWQARRDVRIRPVPTGQLDIAVEGSSGSGLSLMIPVDRPPEGVQVRTVAGRQFAIQPIT